MIVRLLMWNLQSGRLVPLNAKSDPGMRGIYLLLIRKSGSVNYRRVQELGLAIRQTFEEAVQTQLFPRSQIDISVLVMEQDGGIESPFTGCCGRFHGRVLIVGVLQTAINAVTLALVDAGIPMNDYICATSVGLVDNKAILGMSRRD